MEKRTQWTIGYWLLVLLAILTLQDWWQARQEVETVPYSEFEQALADGRISEVLVSDRYVTGKLRTPDPGGKTRLVATRVEPDLAARLGQYDVPYTRVIESTFLRDVIAWVAPAAIFIGLWSLSSGACSTARAAASAAS